MCIILHKTHLLDASRCSNFKACNYVSWTPIEADYNKCSLRYNDVAFLNSNLHCNYFLCKHFVFINNPKRLTMKKENSAFSLRPHCVAWKLFSLCARFFSLSAFAAFDGAFLQWTVNECIPWYAHIIKIQLFECPFEAILNEESFFWYFYIFPLTSIEKFKTILSFLCHECLAGSKSFTIWICID